MKDKRLKQLLLISSLSFLTSCSNTRFSSSIIASSSSNNSIETPTLNVTTFNIGHFSNGTSSSPNGTYNYFGDYKYEFDSIYSDIIAISENSPFFDQEMNIDVRELYSLYYYQAFGSLRNYDCNSLISKFEITNFQEITFSNSSNRYFLDSVVHVSEKDVHVVTTQLDWADIDLRLNQINELLEYLENYKYFILCGDMNPASIINGVSTDEPLSQYLKDYGLYTARGYQLANCGAFGTFNTLVKYEGNYIYPWDNIVFSPNIEIISVRREEVVISDHYPLTAEIRII